MSRFFNSRFSALTPYTPGEQPADLASYTKLNTNESPYPPGPRTVTAVAGAEQEKSLRLYPDPDQTPLKDALAARYGVDASNVFCANGSDDILDFAFVAFGEGGVAFPDITYGFYSVFAEFHGLESVVIPLRKNFSVDIEPYGDLPGVSLVAVPNPNAPTGLQLGMDHIRALIEQDTDRVVIIDEAYIDFGGATCLPLVAEYDNLLVVRTFSKSRSLAGARLGFAIGNRELIADLETIKYSTNPYNINSVSLAAGRAAIEEDDYYMENCRRIAKTREKTVARLSDIGFHIIPSVANFIFVTHPEIPGTEIYEKLKEKRILVRHFDNPAIVEYNRITIGTEEEMGLLISALDRLIEERE